MDRAVATASPMRRVSLWLTCLYAILLLLSASCIAGQSSDSSTGVESPISSSGEPLTDASSSTGGIGSSFDSSSTFDFSSLTSSSSASGSESSSSSFTSSSGLDIDSSSGDVFSSTGVEPSSESSTGGDELTSSSTGDDSESGASSTGESGGEFLSSTGVDDGGESSTGGSDPDAPVDLPVYWVSYLGSDDGACGHSWSSPCLTVMHTFYAIITEETSDESVILIETRDDGGVYPCDRDADGGELSIWQNLHVGTYTLSSDRQSLLGSSVGSTLTFDQHLHAVMEDWKSDIGMASMTDLPAGLTLLNSTTIEHNSTSTGPMWHRAVGIGSGKVTFDCQNDGRAFYIYYDARVHLSGLSFTRGNDAEYIAQGLDDGSSITIRGSDTSVLIEGCEFLSHSGSVIQSFDGGAVVIRHSRFQDGGHTTLGAAISIRRIEPDSNMPIEVFEATPVQSLTLIDSCTFQGFAATLAGGAILLEHQPQMTHGLLGVTRSVFIDNAVREEPTVPQRRGGAVSITHFGMYESAMVIGGNVFAENELTLRANDVETATALQAGGALAIYGSGSVVDSSILLLANRFTRNSAVSGGAAAIFSTSQIGSIILTRDNVYEENFVHSQGHSNAGGALRLGFGPRLDGVNCARLVAFGPCDPTVEPSTRATVFRIERETFVDNMSQKIGGALSILYYPVYQYPGEIPAESGLAPGNVIQSATYAYVINSTNGYNLTSYVPEFIDIVDSTFLRNRVTVNLSLNAAATGIGGAIHFELSPDLPLPIIYDLTTDTLNYAAFAFTSHVRMTRTNFLNNTASCANCMGGCIFAKHGRIELVDSSMVNCETGLFGGSIYADSDSTRLELNTTTFSGSQARIAGQVLYSLSSASHQFRGALFDLDPTIQGEITHILSSIGGRFEFINGTRMVCGSGYSLRNQSVLHYRASTTTTLLGQLVSTVSYHCAPCPINTFSLNRGMQIDETWSDATNELNCLSCPFGADCSRGINQIASLPGNWALLTTQTTGSSLAANQLSQSKALVFSTIDADDTRDESRLDFFSCPIGYCCPPRSVCPFNYCSGNRHGTLCGECLPGYSLVLGSVACRKSNDCNDAGWFWTLLILISLGLTLFYLIGINRDTSTGTGAGDAVGAMRDPPPSLAAIVKVLVYFVQMFAAVVTSDDTNPKTNFVRWTSSILNLGLNNDVSTDQSQINDAMTHQRTEQPSTLGVCVSSDLTPEGKIAYGYVFSFLVILWVAFFYLLYCSMTLVRGGNLIKRSTQWLETRALTRIRRDDKMLRLQDEQKKQEEKFIGMARRASIVGGTGPTDGNMLSNFVTHKPPTARPGGMVDPTAAESVPRVVSSCDVELVDVRMAHSDATDSDSQGQGAGMDHSQAATSDDAGADGDLRTIGARSQPSAASLDNREPSASIANFSCPMHGEHGLKCLFAGTWIDVILLCFTAFVQTSALLVQCVEVDGKSRLLLGAEVECYTGAQRAALAFLILLSLLPILLFAFSRRVSCHHAVWNLHAPFRTSLPHYEVVLMLRRYLFIIIFTFTTDRFLRSILLMCVVVASLLIHYQWHPWRARFSNQLESICLLCLLTVSAVQIRSSTLRDAGVVIESDSTQARISDQLANLTLAMQIIPFGAIILLAAWRKYGPKHAHTD